MLINLSQSCVIYERNCSKKTGDGTRCVVDSGWEESLLFLVRSGVTFGCSVVDLVVTGTRPERLSFQKKWSCELLSELVCVVCCGDIKYYAFIGVVWYTNHLDSFCEIPCYPKHHAKC